MSKQFIVVDKLEDWSPYYPSENLITVEALLNADPSPDRPAEVFHSGLADEQLDLLAESAGRMWTVRNFLRPARV